MISEQDRSVGIAKATHARERRNLKNGHHPPFTIIKGKAFPSSVNRDNPYYLSVEDAARELGYPKIVLDNRSEVT